MSHPNDTIPIHCIECMTYMGDSNIPIRHNEITFYSTCPVCQDKLIERLYNSIPWHLRMWLSLKHKLGLCRCGK